MNKNIISQINDSLGDYKKTVWVYKKSTNVVSANYDSFRNIGYSKSYQSPTPIKAVVHQISSTGLIAKEIGLSLSGAIEIMVNNFDASLILNASRIKYNEQFYVTFHSATGSKNLVTDLPFGMKKIVCFIRGNSDASNS